jgi:hypothetical protein
VNCTNNYQICTECDQANGYILVNGNCELPKQRLAFLRGAYKYDTSTVTVLFVEEIVIGAAVPFVAIKDEVEEKTYHCESAANKTGIRCELLPLPNGFQIKFTSDVSIVKGKVIIQDPAQQNSPKGYIRAASSKVLFKDYPIVIDGLSFAENKALESAAAPLEAVVTTRSVITSGIQIASIPVAALLDRLICDLDYLKLLEGRVLVFPERVFDSSMSLSTYIPVSLIGVPDWMLAFQDMSTCVPSPAMARNDLYCSILANMGPDVFALAILITICVVISATSNRIIDYRIRKKGLDSPKPEQESSIRKDWTCLGRGYIPPDVQLTMTDKFLVGLRETYGVTFFIVKLEATQLDMITLMVLNFWNYGEGIVEMYGVFLSLIFTIYYLLQGYFTYTFAQQIWQEVQKYRNEAKSHEDEKGAQKRPYVTTAPNKIKTKDKQIQDEQLESFFSTVDSRSFMFERLKVPNKFEQLCEPLARLARSFLLAFALVVLASVPLIQVITASIVEAGYLLFIIKSNIKASRSEFVYEVISQSFIILYLVGKMLTIPDLFSESTNQTVLGIIIGWLLILYSFVGILFALYSLCLALWESIQNCRKKRVNQVEQANSRDCRTADQTVSAAAIKPMDTQNSLSGQKRIAHDDPEVLQSYSNDSNSPIKNSQKNRNQQTRPRVIEPVYRQKKMVEQRAQTSLAKFVTPGHSSKPMKVKLSSNQET